MENWTPFGVRLAEQAADPDSRWLAPAASVPRHELIPRWWERIRHRLNL